MAAGPGGPEMVILGNVSIQPSSGRYGRDEWMDRAGDNHFGVTGDFSSTLYSI